MSTILGGSGWDYATALADFAPVATSGSGSTSTANTPFTSGRRALLRAAPDNDVILPQFSSAVSEVWLHTWVYQSSNGGNPLIVVFYDSVGAPQCSMRIGGTQIDAWRGDQTTLLGSATYSSIAGVNTYVQARVLVSSTAGAIEVYFNLSSTPVLTLTGINTQATGNANVQSARFTTSGFGGNTGIDDTWFVTERSTGYLRTYVLPAGGAGTSSGWPTIVGAATAWQALSDNPFDGDTSYIASDTPGQVTLVVPGTNAVANYVAMVRPYLFGRFTGSAGSAACQVSLGGYSDTLGTKALTSSYSQVDAGIFNLNPTNGSAWTIAQMNALNWGPSLVSVTGTPVRMSAAGLEIVADLGLPDATGGGGEGGGGDGPGPGVIIGGGSGAGRQPRREGQYFI